MNQHQQISQAFLHPSFYRPMQNLIHWAPEKRHGETLDSLLIAALRSGFPPQNVHVTMHHPLQIDFTFDTRNSEMLIGRYQLDYELQHTINAINNFIKKGKNRTSYKDDIFNHVTDLFSDMHFLWCMAGNPSALAGFHQCATDLANIANVTYHHLPTIRGYKIEIQSALFYKP